MQTMVVELGTGVDLHGQDTTSAAIKAVKNAFAHVSLPGLRAFAGSDDLSGVQVDVLLGCPPETQPIDTERVAAVFPHGKVNISVEQGGLLAPGGSNPKDPIVMVNAAIYVRAEQRK